MPSAALGGVVATIPGFGSDRRLSFGRGELTGALGNSVTVLPIVVAVAALTPLGLGRLLVGFAVFQVVWGLYYGVPVSVEPMKALAALVVAGSLSADGLAAAGLLAGVALLALGRAGWLARVERLVGEPAIRGVQLAVALVLLETGVGLALDGPGLAALGAGVVAVAALAGHARAGAPLVLGVGVALAAAGTGLPAPTVPAVSLRLPAAGAFLDGATLRGLLAQLAMTVGNAAVATSLLLGDYFDAEISADALATSMGLTNLVAVPLGAMPMCHGSGGVAGTYAFGARTAGASVVLGLWYLVAATLGVGLVAAFPLPVLGVVLAVVAVGLGRSGLDSQNRPLTVAVGLCGLLANVGVAFVAGAAGGYLVRRWRNP